MATELGVGYPPVTRPSRAAVVAAIGGILVIAVLVASASALPIFLA